VRLITLDAAAAAERDAAAAIEASGVPFLVALTVEHRRHLDEVAAATCHLALDGDEVIGVIRAVAVRWDGTPGDAPTGGAGEALARADEPDADTLAVLDVTVPPERRDSGVGTALLRRLGPLADELGLRRTLVLLRPHAKAAHPLTPFIRYLHATGDDPAAPFDGWLRAAWRAGLRPVAAVDRSLVASAPLESWSAWCGGRAFPTSGPELVPGAIKPAVIEFERGEGRYREPHLWAAPAEDLADEVGRPPGWRDALDAVGIVAGDRAHREVKRRR
jgi:GNAT superfamily N-acetyltransferase